MTLRIIVVSLLAMMMAPRVAATVDPQSPAQGKIPTVPVSAKKDAYAFATAVVEGMEDYIDAEEAFTTLPHTSQGMTDVVNRLASTRTAQAKWRLAASYLTRFRTSRDTFLADFSKQLGDAYTIMSESYGQSVALQEAMLRNTSNPAEVAIEMSKIQAKGNQVIDLIAIGTANVANCMIDLSRTDADGHATYLKLTLEERTDVTNRLKTLAGPSPEDETTDDKRSTARIGALVLWRWFRGGWHSSDER